MANAFYEAGSRAFLKGEIDLLNDTIKVQLVDTADYTLDLVNHDFYDDITAAGRVGTATAVTTPTVTGAGVFDADDVTLVTVTGDQAELLIIFKDTGVEATSPLIAAFDTATGLPVTPGGGNIPITWDVAGIFSKG